MSKFNLFGRKDTLTKVEEVDEDNLMSGSKKIHSHRFGKFGKFPTQFTANSHYEESSPYKAQRIERTDNKMPTLSQFTEQPVKKEPSSLYKTTIEDSIYLEGVSNHNRQHILNLLNSAVRDYIESKDSLIIQLAKDRDLTEYLAVVQKYLDDQLEDRTRVSLITFPKKEDAVEDKEHVRTPCLDLFGKLIDILFSW
jgi:hypothetical protein